MSIAILVFGGLGSACYSGRAEGISDSDDGTGDGTSDTTGASSEPGADTTEGQATEGVFPRFDDPQVCGGCHVEHYEQWEMSPHAYAVHDPVFVAMVDAGQRATEGDLGDFCVQCHSPAGMLEGQTAVEFDAETRTYRQELRDLDPAALAGVSCDVCHSIESVEHPFNAGITYANDGVKRGPIPDPSPNTRHESAYSPLHEESELCGACHNVINDQGALLDLTYDEWSESRHAEQGRSCQGCHMQASRGRAAVGGPERDIHDHRFVGVDVSLLPPDQFPGYEEMRRRSRDLLRSAARLRVETVGRELHVEIQNLAGHALPTGSTAERQMWLELIVTDDRGELVFSSGTLDDRGDLRDGLSEHSLEPGTDPQLAYWGQQLVFDPRFALATTPDERERAQAQATAECVPMGQGAVAAGSSLEPVTFAWEANWQCDYLIAADSTAEHRFVLPPEVLRGTYRAQVRLRYRAFPPHFLRTLERIADLDPEVEARVPIVAMAGASVVWAVGEGG